MKYRILLALVITLIIFTASGIVRAEKAHAYDPNDPYDSGCVYNQAAPQTSGDLSVNGYTVHAVNWYSQGCNKNWAVISWSGGSAVHTMVDIRNHYGASECYPTDCMHLYAGGLSPSWTDMIDGSKTAYVALIISNGSSFSYSPNDWLPA